MNRRQFTVYGKVQGVWFRACARGQAIALHLSGYASNLADGSVQVQAQGDTVALDRLEQWLRVGPALAKVSRVDILELEPRLSESGFEIH